VGLLFWLLRGSGHEPASNGRPGQDKDLGGRGRQVVQPGPNGGDAPTREKVLRNSLGMGFRLIPGGKFTMGSPMRKDAPEHTVEITKPFYMGTTEVTVGQFKQFVAEDDYKVGRHQWSNKGPEYPVVYVTWQNAVDFCAWLSKKEGKKYRLPTEAEWEYCCRAGRAGTSDDDTPLGDLAWYRDNARSLLQPVGKKKANAWGLHDMHGNAAEWCQDCFAFDYYKNSPAKDPTGAEGGDRVLRGGSYAAAPAECRCGFRDHNRSDYSNYNIGFRVVLAASSPGGAGQSGR
jgi:formylglycine-generating enzyme required for sulfatase activity